MSTEMHTSDIFMNFRYPSEAEVERTFACERFQVVRAEAQNDPYVEKACNTCPLSVEAVPNLEQNFIEGVCQNTTS